MTPERLIIDCDPGVDDAIALLLAAAHPRRLSLAGVTTVAGNVSLAQATANAGDVLALARCTGVPLSAGCHRPIMRAEGLQSKVHGAGGIGGLTTAQPRVMASGMHAVDFLIEAVRAAPGAVTLCPIGPLTNVALAMLKDPGFAPALARIVLMGGAAFVPGNVTPSAEFNVLVDPHAAQVVFSSGVEITMLGLDVTHQATLSEAWLDEVSARAGEIGAAAAGMLRAYRRGDPCLHDPCVIAYLLEPQLFEAVSGHVEVQCSLGATHGMTVAAVRPSHLAGREPNCRIVTKIDASGLRRLLVDSLAALQHRIDAGAGSTPGRPARKD